MTCRKCQHDSAHKFGTYGKNKVQRYRCRACNATFADEAPKSLGTHYLPQEQVVKIIAMMMEGVSIRAISRLTGTDKGTILSLLVDAGKRCRSVFDAKVRNIRPRHVQCDETWSYIGAHQMRMREDAPPEWGHIWTWIALDADTKMILSYRVGDRNTRTAIEFMYDLRSRTVGTYQLTTDALRSYQLAVEENFGSDVHFAQLLKVFSKAGVGGPGYYGSGQVVAAVPSVRTGHPDYRHISTSFIERFNLTLRMHIRRHARLTNAYSKKLANHQAALDIFMAYYNLCKSTLPHSCNSRDGIQELRITSGRWRSC